jgi:DNA-binding LacI/PurR family transcriptional regulator
LKSVKVKDVADLAGVSTATVSRVFNNSRKVSPNTRMRVLEAAQRLGYKFNFLARSFKLQKSMMLAIVLPEGIQEPLHQEFVTVAEERFFKNGFGTFLCSSRGSLEREAMYLETLVARRIDGILLAPVSWGGSNRHLIEEIVAEGIPIVFWDRYLEGINASFVGSENTASVYDCVKDLLMRGYTRTVFMGIDAATSSFERLEGYKKAFADVGLAVNEEYIHFDNRFFHEFFDFHLQQGCEHLAFFCINSYVAEKLLWYIHDKGLCRKNIPIVTFDDTSLGEHLGIPVTCIIQKAAKMAVECSEILMDMVNGGGSESRIIRVMPDIIVKSG